MEIDKWPNLEKFLNDYKDVFQSKLQERLQENNSNASYSLLKSIEMRVDVDGSEFVPCWTTTNGWTRVQPHIRKKGTAHSSLQ